MRGDAFAALAVAALLVLGGCTGASSSNPATATETTVESTAVTTAETATTALTPSAPATAATVQSKTAERTTTKATESNRSGPNSLFAAYGVELNYSAGGDLDADQVARSHVEAAKAVESATAVIRFRTETNDRTSSQYVRTERNATHRFHRQNGAGTDVAVYEGPNIKAMAVAGENGTEYVRIGDDDGSQVSNSGLTEVFLLAKLQTMPYEAVGTVERNGTTLTEYEATGPGYFAAQENVTVDSFASTLLVDQRGLVRYFHHEVEFRRGDRTRRVELTLRYAAVGTTDVTVPDWLDEVRRPDDEGTSEGSDE